VGEGENMPRRGPRELEELLRREFSPRRFPGEKPSWEDFEFITHLDNQLF
jgi:ribosomal protein S10